MRMLVVARMRLVAVAVERRRDRIEVDAGGFDGRLGLGPVALGIVAGEVAPGLHASSGAARGAAWYASTIRV